MAPQENKASPDQLRLGQLFNHIQWHTTTSTFLIGCKLGKSLCITKPGNGTYLSLLAAADWTQLEDRTSEISTTLGAEAFILRVTPSHAGKSDQRTITSLPTEYKSLLAQGGRAADPIECHFASSSLPVAWQVEHLQEEHPESPEYAMLGRLGFSDGLSIVHRKNTINIRVDFIGTRPWASREEDQGSFVLLSMYLHEAAETVWRRQASAAKVQLSARETECLTWSAVGKTSSEVALILGISRRTVYFHLTNVAAKLEVYTTRHAITRAMSLGLLQQPC